MIIAVGNNLLLQKKLLYKHLSIYDLRLKFTVKYAINAAPIPKIFASKPKGKLMPEIIKVSVVPPPTIIEESAANEFGFCVNNAANTGIIIPDTINE